MTGGLTEHTARQLVAALGRLNDELRLRRPETYDRGALERLFPGRSIDWIRQRAVRHAGYAPRRGTPILLTARQVTRLLAGIEAEAGGYRPPTDPIADLLHLS